MTLLPFLLAGHFIGDWIFQSDWMAANKATLRRAMSMHMLTYHAAVLGCLLIPWHDGTHFWKGALIVAVSWATHSFIDRRWPVIWLMRATGSAAFAESWGLYAVDQALHLSILCLLAGTVPA